MNDNTLSIWRKPWNGAAKCLAWYGLLALAILVVFLGISLAIGPSPKGSDVLGMALASALLAGLLVVATLFVRWLCCGRKLRWFLLGVAGVIFVIALGYVEEDWRGSQACPTEKIRASPTIPFLSHCLGRTPRRRARASGSVRDSRRSEAPAAPRPGRGCRIICAIVALGNGAPRAGGNGSCRRGRFAAGKRQRTGLP